MIRLTPRQQTIAELVPPCECVADIGCDHGRLGAYLLQAGIVKKVIAADISAPSLLKAEQLAAHLALIERFDFRVGNGLAVLSPGEADCIVIAGMGGGTILEILKGFSFTGERIIVQPMNGIELLKGALASLGLALINEYVVMEGRRFYEIAVIEVGEFSPCELDLYLPMAAIRRGDAVCKDYLLYKLVVLCDAQKSAPNNGEIQRKIRLLKEGLAWLP